MPPRPRPYDKFFVAYKIGADRQLRRLPPQQRWVWVAGVLALAAQSPIRGHLLIGEEEVVTVKDIADEAAVGKGLAGNAVLAFRKLGLIQTDEELGCEYIPNWEIYNPKPAATSTEGERLRKREQRARRQLEQRRLEAV